MTLKLTRKNLFKFCLASWIVVSVFFGRTMITDVIGTMAITIYSNGRLLIYALLFCVILWGKISKYETIGLIMVSLILTLSAINSGEAVLLGILLFVGATKRINTEEIIQTYFVTHLAIVVVTIILATTHIIDTNVMSRGLTQRNSFGFTHPNCFGGEILTLVVSYTIIRWQKLNSFKVMVFTVVSLIFLHEADCRMASIVLVMYVFCVLIIKNFYKYHVNVARVKKIVKILFLALIAVTIFVLMVYSYKSGVLGRIDAILSYRFSAMHVLHKLQGIKLFGQKIIDEALVGIDNSYARVLLINGLFPFIVLIVFSVSICNEFAKRRELKYLLAFGVIALSGFMENSFFRIENNYCFLIGGSYLLSRIYTRKRERIDVKNTNGKRVQ